MSDHETAVRDAADALLAAITDAQADGYVVDWPRNAAGLAGMGISETGAVKLATPAAIPVAAAPAMPVTATFGNVAQVAAPVVGADDEPTHEETH